MPSEKNSLRSLSPEEYRERWRRFTKEEEPTLLQGYRRASWLTAIFILAGSFMDLFVYRDYWANFLILRIAASAALGILYFLFVWPPLQKHTRILAHFQALIPIFIIEWMILVIGDKESPYYAGLSLVLVGSVLMHRWSTKDGLINAIFVVGSYLGVAAAISNPLDDPAPLIRNAFFLVITAAISCIGLYYYKRLLFEDFCLRDEVSVTNQELANALKELRENEARLLHAEKLSSLGRMSAGIVHEINNPLNYTKTALHALRMFTDDVTEEEREDFSDMLNDADEGVGRVIQIVSDLRSFTKGQSPGHRPILIAEIIESARRLLSQDLREIDFSVDAEPDLEIFGNDNQLVQVLVNLLQNAAQAVQDVPARGERPQIKVTTSTLPNSEVILRIRDNGCGIPAEELENIFDPFFTKRDVGEGMGLGLSICHRIIENHQARTEVTSEVDQFTEFAIFFPDPNKSITSETNVLTESSVSS